MDPIAAQFRGPWRLELNGELGLPGVLKLQAAWSALSTAGRAALVDLVEVPGSADWHHGLTIRALIRHGLVNENGEATPAGHAVVEHRPRTGPSWTSNRPEPSREDTA